MYTFIYAKGSLKLLSLIAWPKILLSALYSIQIRKHLVFGQFNFSSVFICFSFDAINWQTLRDCGILHQIYGII